MKLLPKYNDLYNPETIKLGCYLNFNNTWVEVYELHGNVFIKNLDLLIFSEKTKEVRNIKDHQEKENLRKEWINKKLLLA